MKKLTPDLELKIQQWTQFPYDSETSKEIQTLLDQKNETELYDRFYRELEFGTGGMRGVMAAGTNRMNRYTVAQATQGLANYLKELNVSDKGVVIAFDSRNNSRFFAKTAANVLAGNLIPVYFFEDPHPTPFLSFAVRHLKATAGILITASHNPPEYNGYKVFFEDGGQILPPHDANIISHVQKISSLDKVSWGNESQEHTQIKIMDSSTEEAYYQAVEKCLDLDQFQQPGNFKTVYTSLHGAGLKFVKTLLAKRLGIPLETVKEQESFDGNFPTVKSPNPEESEALTLAIRQAEQNQADLVLATDPDADRLGVAVKTKEGFRLLNGNQVGVLMLHYLLTHRQLKNHYAVSTIVSSDLIHPMAKEFGLDYTVTLTGFKYIGGVITQREKDQPFLFGYEESFGFLIGDYVRDKDGISAAALLCEIAIQLKKQGKNLYDALLELYRKYGFYEEGLTSFTLKGEEGSEKIKEIMAFFRKNNSGDLFGFPILKTLDLKEQTCFEQGKKSSYTEFPKSDVLVFYLSPYFKLAVRPSGTEPKIKFYTAICGAKETGFSHNEFKKQLTEFENKIVKSLKEKFL